MHPTLLTQPVLDTGDVVRDLRARRFSRVGLRLAADADAGLTPDYRCCDDPGMSDIEVAPATGGVGRGWQCSVCLSCLG